MFMHANYDVKNKLCYVIVLEKWHYVWTHYGLLVLRSC